MTPKLKDLLSKHSKHLNAAYGEELRESRFKKVSEVLKHIESIEGMNDWLMNITLEELRIVLNEDIVEHSFAEDTQAIMAEIRKAGEKKISMLEIKKATGIDNRKITQRLHYLNKQGIIKSTGEKKRKRYYIEIWGTKSFKDIKK